MTFGGEAEFHCYAIFDLASVQAIENDHLKKMANETAVLQFSGAQSCLLPDVARACPAPRSSV